MVLVANQAHGEAGQKLEMSYLEKMGAEVVEFRATEQKTTPEKSLQKRPKKGDGK